MANARKCDRCGAFFDPVDLDKKYSGMVTTRFQNPVFQTEEDAQKHRVTRYLFMGASDATVDLCPDCTEDFELFMEGYELAVRENAFGRSFQEERDIPKESNQPKPPEDCDLLKKMKTIAKDLWGEEGPWKTVL